MVQLTGTGFKLASKLGQLTMQKWAIGIGVLAVAISGLFGGLDAVPQKPTGVGVAIDAGLWNVTVTGARLVRDLPPMRLSDKKNYWIVVLATVEIKADRTWNILDESVQLAPIPGIKQKPTKTLTGMALHQNEGTVLMRDATVIRGLHPGMPEKLAYFWELESTAPIPSEVTVYIGFRKYRMDGLTSKMEWMEDSEHNKSVVVPVVDRRTAMAANP
jgi:hypothetical protein